MASIPPFPPSLRRDSSCYTLPDPVETPYKTVSKAIETLQTGKRSLGSADLNDVEPTSKLISGRVCALTEIPPQVPSLSLSANFCKIQSLIQSRKNLIERMLEESYGKLQDIHCNFDNFLSHHITPSPNTLIYRRAMFNFLFKGEKCDFEELNIRSTVFLINTGIEEKKYDKDALDLLGNALYKFEATREASSDTTLFKNRFKTVIFLLEEASKKGEKPSLDHIKTILDLTSNIAAIFDESSFSEDEIILSNWIEDFLNYSPEAFKIFKDFASSSKENISYFSEGLKEILEKVEYDFKAIQQNREWIGDIILQLNAPTNERPKTSTHDFVEPITINYGPINLILKNQNEVDCTLKRMKEFNDSLYEIGNMLRYVSLTHARVSNMHLVNLVLPSDEDVSDLYQAIVQVKSPFPLMDLRDPETGKKNFLYTLKNQFYALFAYKDRSFSLNRDIENIWNEYEASIKNIIIEEDKDYKKLFQKFVCLASCLFPNYSSKVYEPSRRDFDNAMAKFKEAIDKSLAPAQNLELNLEEGRRYYDWLLSARKTSYARRFFNIENIPFKG